MSDLKNAYGQLQGFSADDALSKLRQLRRDSNQNLNAPYNPQQQALGRAQRTVSDAIESQMERAVQATDPTLLDRFRNARTQLAKINNVQNALDESGNVSARDLARMADKGVPFTGRLGIIADTARAFPNVTGDLTALKNRSGFTVPELAYGVQEGALPLLGALGGAEAHGAVGSALGALTAIAARHGVRSFLGSDLYQNMLGRVAPELGPNSALGDYFAPPNRNPWASALNRTPPGAGPGVGPAGKMPGIDFTPPTDDAASMLRANQRAGDLRLQGDAEGGIPYTVDPGTPTLGDILAARNPKPGDAGSESPGRQPVLAGDGKASFPDIHGTAPTGTPDATPSTLGGQIGAQKGASTEDSVTAFDRARQGQASDSLRDLVAQIKGTPSGDNKQGIVQYADTVHPDAVDAFKQAGVDVSGFSHVIDANSIRHILKKHGNANTEISRGQLPITEDDIAALPQIVGSFDSVAPAGQPNGKQPRVMYQKDIGGTTYVVEEARTGKKQLAVVSMWKKRGGRPTPVPGPEPSSGITSATGSDPGPNPTPPTLGEQIGGKKPPTKSGGR